MIDSDAFMIDSDAIKKKFRKLIIAIIISLSKEKNIYKNLYNKIKLVSSYLNDAKKFYKSVVLGPSHIQNVDLPA